MSGRVGIGRTLVLVAIMVATLGWTLHRLQGGTAIVPQVSAPVDVTVWEKPAFDPLPAAADSSVLRDHPLTYATREPYSAPVQTDPVAPPVPAYYLVGALIAPSKPASALLAPVAGEAPARRVAQGDDVEGWRVERVELHGAVLRSGDQIVEITRTGSVTGSAGLVRMPVGVRGSQASGGVLSVPSPGVGGQARVLSAPSAGGKDSTAPKVKASLLTQPRLYRPPPP